MTSETTSMQYTHDTSDGRNRLIWTKDQDNDVTIYGYGAEGIVWSLCNGEYMVYHYDYRGSVTAVTDIDGSVTDTVKYDVYGAVAARTGDSELILGYNGEYGVLTDPSGLLYMRTRYYSPNLKRFLSADVINGSIADSTTLNLYAYVNGNPISFIDPFGLTAERTDGEKKYLYGSVLYDDVYYPIYVPNYGPEDSNVWETVYEDTVHNFEFDWIQFISGIEIEDFNGESTYAGSVMVSSGKVTDRNHLKYAGILSLFCGVLNSAQNCSDGIYVNFEFQKSGDQRRVILSAGTNNSSRLFETYADGKSHSLYWESGGSSIGSEMRSGEIRNLYYELTGNYVSILQICDLSISVDKSHLSNPYSSYLWINSNGTIMESPIIYENDKVEIVNKGFFGFGNDVLYSIPLGGYYEASGYYQKAFNDFFKEN